MNVPLPDVFRNVFVTRRDRDRVLGWVVVFALVVLVGYVLTREFAPFLLDPRGLREWVLGFGVWAPAVFVSVQVGQVVFAPIPGQVMGFVGGYLFGVVPGTVYSVVGVSIGSTVVFVLSRRFGRNFVENVLAAELLDEFDGVVAEGGETALFLAFLIPGLPDDALCFVAGLTDIPLWRLVAIAVVGRTPSLLLATVVGAQLASQRFLDAALLALGLTALALLGYRYRERLGRYLAAD